MRGKCIMCEGVDCWISTPVHWCSPMNFHVTENAHMDIDSWFVKHKMVKANNMMEALSTVH